jgi:hypothetical protein
MNQHKNAFTSLFVKIYNVILMDDGQQQLFIISSPLSIAHEFIE